VPCPNAAGVFEYLDTEVVMGRLSPRALQPIMGVTVQCEGAPLEGCEPVSNEEVQVVIDRFKEAMDGDNPPPDERAFELRIKIDDALNRVLLWTNTLPSALLDYEQDNDPADFERIDFALGDYYGGSLTGLEDSEGRRVFMGIADTCRRLLSFATSQEELEEIATSIDEQYKDIYIGPKVERVYTIADAEDRQILAKGLQTEQGFFAIAVEYLPGVIARTRSEDAAVKKKAEKELKLITEEMCKYFGSEATFARPETPEAIEAFITAAESAKVAVAGFRDAGATSSQLQTFMYWAAKNYVTSHGLETGRKEDPLF
jgi:tetratricopeptide (TPR) repeat protein